MYPRKARFYFLAKLPVHYCHQLLIFNTLLSVFPILTIMFNTKLLQTNIIIISNNKKVRFEIKVYILGGNGE